jgi:hypothetical protein
VDNLTTNDGTKALSAKQGYLLNSNIAKYEIDSNLSKAGNVVILNFSAYALTGIDANGKITEYTIPSEYRPTKNITGAAIIQGSTSILYFGFIAITTSGEIVVKCITTYPATSSVPASSATVTGTVCWTI